MVEKIIMTGSADIRLPESKQAEETSDTHPDLPIPFKEESRDQLAQTAKIDAKMFGLSGEHSHNSKKDL